MSRIVDLAGDSAEHVPTDERLPQGLRLEGDQLASGIGHDFNNLLSIILSYARLVQDDFAAGDPRRAYLDQVLWAGERGANLAQQLLAIGRDCITRADAVDVREIVVGMQHVLRHVLPGNIDLVVLDTAPGGHVCADAGQLEQVVLNLVVNARDAMADGGTLTIETAAAMLDASQAASLGVAPGAHVRLTVRDSGVGMDEGTRSRVFEPFFTTKASGKGTGLGLAMVLGIVERAGGGIRVASSPGEGSSFDIYLPRIEAASEARTAPPPAPVIGGTETVLVVEDEPCVRALVHTILRCAGYHVLEAETVGDALLVSEQYAGTVHVLLTDVVMPRLNGPELAERLATFRPSMKVLFLSGYGEDETIVPREALDRGVAFIRKPITPEGLTRKLREVLDYR